MQLFEIKRFLDRGDYVKIARAVGYSNPSKGRIYVYQVISGKIAANRGLALQIVRAAEIQAEHNKAAYKVPNKE